MLALLDLRDKGKETLWDDKAHLWGWDLLELGMKLGVLEISPRDLGSGLGSGGHFQGTKRLVIHALHPAATRTWVGCQALGGTWEAWGGLLCNSERAGMLERRRESGVCPPPPPPPPPAPEATLGFIIGSLSGSFPLI